MIPFKPNFILPNFLLTLTTASKTGLKKDDSSFRAESSKYLLEISFDNVNPRPIRFEDNDSLTVILGAPIVGEQINCKAAKELIICKDGISQDKLAVLNGEFLIIYFNKKTSELSILNDRYTSIPLFYHHDPASGSFCSSIYFSSIWQHLKSIGKREFNQNAFFEFLWFQRLFGTKTYEKNTLFLPDASLLNFKDNNLSIGRYWQRDYEKSQLSFSKHAENMADFVRKSVKQKSSDNKRFGHFLSGGMDSRTVLSAFDDNPPVCFTSTISENREFRKAQEIAEAKGAKHIGLELDPEHFGKIFRHSTAVIGGMYNYDHGLFYGFEDVVKEHADVCFHGHGFDYMFQGMYIPGKDVVVGGRHLYLRHMMDLPENLVSFFINNASYRVKDADIWSFVKNDFKKNLKEFQKESIQKVLDEGKKLTGNPVDLWEYLTFHHISRHYSYPNHASIATFAEQRTVAFDNDLFNLYLSLPHEHRFNGKIEKQCLKLLDPKIAKIWSANTNLPVTASSFQQTMYQIAGFIKRRIVPEKQKETWQERTWPLRADALRSQKSLKDAVKALCSSDTFEQLDFLDIQKLKHDIPKWIDGENVPGVSGDLVQTLLTMGTFLEQ